MRSFYLGLDLARQRDHSAIAVIEKGNGREVRFLNDRVVRAVKRIPLEMPYR